MKEVSSSSAIILEKIQTYLAYRAHSEYELELKLSKKFNKAEIKEALKKARENNWLDSPSQMARDLADEWHRKKRGWRLIKAALLKKKLPLLNKQEDLEQEKCSWWLDKKWSDLETPSYVTIQKISSFLANRGFEEHTIRETTRKRWANYE